MFLSDRHLRELALERELVSPFNEKNCEGASINITLHKSIKKYITHEPIIFGNKLTETDYQEIDITASNFYLEPGESVLVQSIEYFKIPDDMCGVILERYSVKLLGLMISPASYMNPGYEGRLSFLAVNHSPKPIQLVAGVKFCQLMVAKLSSEADKPYRKQDAKYMGTLDVSISKLHLDREIQEFLLDKGITNVSNDTAKELGQHLLKLIDKSADKIADELRKKFGDISE